MDIRQVLRDKLLLLKESRKHQVLAGVVILLVMWMLLADGKPRRPQQVVEESTAVGTGNMGVEEAYQDLLTRFGDDLKTVRQQSEQNLEALQSAKEDLSKHEERTAEIFKKVLERIADIEQTGNGQGDQGRMPADAPEGDIGELPSDALVSFGDVAEQEIAPPAAPEPNRKAVISAGDSVQVELLAGVHAPTDGTPYPVVFKLSGDITGPDGSSLPLGEGRLIAAAQGSLADARALFRLTNLSIRHPDGSRSDVKVDGWIVGEDGIRGMEGILIDPIGKALAGTLVAGTVEGIGDGLSQSQTSTYFNDDGGVFTNVDGDLAEYALGRGMNRAGDRYARIIEDRLKLLVPHVKVLSGRKASAVFSKTVPVDNVFDSLNGDYENLTVSLD